MRFITGPFSRLWAPFSAVVIILLCTSCGSTRKAVYFDNIQDATIPITIENLEPVLQKNDLLSISVGSLNRTASEAFNAPNSSGTLTQASGYLIDQDGNIKFPVLGTIKAAGITKKALGDYITKSLIESKQLLDPVVTVRYLNFKVTVLGEVARPMVVSVPNEKITLLEALGTAGDLTLFARRNNVLILRDEANSRIVKRIDLNSRELLTSPYFNLKSNDVIYVEPNKAKVASTTRTTQLLPIILSGLSVLFVVVERYIGNN